MNYNIIINDKIESSEFVSLVRSVGWMKSDKSLSEINKAIDNTFWMASIRTEDNKLIGIVRVLSDDVFFTTISEIIVHPDFQKLNLGSKLLSAVKYRFNHTKIFLGSRKGLEKFYMKNGFSEGYRGFYLNKNENSN